VKSVAVYVVVDSVGKLCSLTVQLNVLWAAETNSKSWTGKTHIKTFLPLLTFIFYGDVGFLMTLANIRLPFVYNYIKLCCDVLCIVCFVSLCVLFVRKCVLYCCHGVTTQLQLTNILISSFLFILIFSIRTLSGRYNLTFQR